MGAPAHPLFTNLERKQLDPARYLGPRHVWIPDEVDPALPRGVRVGVVVPDEHGSTLERRELV